MAQQRNFIYTSLIKCPEILKGSSSFTEENSQSLIPLSGFFMIWPPATQQAPSWRFPTLVSWSTELLAPWLTWYLFPLCTLFFLPGPLLLAPPSEQANALILYVLAQNSFTPRNVLSLGVFSVHRLEVQLSLPSVIIAQWQYAFIYFLLDCIHTELEAASALLPFIPQFLCVVG